MCRHRAPIEELARYGRDAQGRWYFGAGPGRGIWRCRSEKCASQVTLAQLRRALRDDVAESVWQELVSAEPRDGSVVVKE